MGVDSGGSFTKIVYFRPKSAPDLPDYVFKDQELPKQLPGLKPDPSIDIINKGTLKFIRIPRHKSDEFIHFVGETKLHSQFNIECLNITGGGAFRLAPNLQKKLNITVEPLGETDMLVAGLSYLLEYDCSNEVYTVDPVTKEKTFGVFKNVNEIYPFILVNVGSGVSILKISGKDEFERVSGSTVGGGTFWALCRLLTGATSYDQVQKLSESGDSKNVDLHVGDIYGFDSSAPGYHKLGLSPDIIASSFGKIAVQEELPDLRPGDVVRSLMFMMANNISQIAYLIAQLQKVDRIIFAGGFLADNVYLLSRISYALHYWTDAKMKPYFLRHDGYLGALGAMLHKSNNNNKPTNKE
uniref:pantothenate kinase n=1 Tax=Arcella intermedia TaxID=1963864 RepID=A0A6B2L761_9EUKA